MAAENSPSFPDAARRTIGVSSRQRFPKSSRNSLWLFSSDLYAIGNNAHTEVREVNQSPTKSNFKKMNLFYYRP